MKAFLSIKFWGDNRNKDDIEKIIDAAESAGIIVFCLIRDVENWGKKSFTPEDIMKLTLENIEKSDFLLANVADWPIGVGVEAGYAYAKGIPIVCICPDPLKTPNTVAVLAQQTIKYKNYNDLKIKLRSLVL